MSLSQEPPDWDPESEGPGPGDAPRSDQAPLHHQHRQDGRDPGQIAARWHADSCPVLHCGNYESHVWRGVSSDTLMVWPLLGGSRCQARLTKEDSRVCPQSVPPSAFQWARFTLCYEFRKLRKREGKVMVSHGKFIESCTFWETISLTRLSPQIWDETFQRVTNEQEIYEGLSLMIHARCYPPIFSFLFFLIFISVACSPASWSDAAEAGELVSDHHRQTDQPLHSVHCQGQREAGAQVGIMSSGLLSYSWLMTGNGCKHNVPQ